MYTESICLSVTVFARVAVMIEFHKRGTHKNFRLLVNVFCPKTWSNFSTHGYYYLTKFSQDWIKNKKHLLIGEKFCEDLFNGILS